MLNTLTSSTLRLGMWKNDRSNLSLTCVCRSGKQPLMFRSTSALSCEQIELPVQLSFDVPSLLCSHNDVSLSLTFAILELSLYFSQTSCNGVPHAVTAATASCRTHETTTDSNAHAQNVHAPKITKIMINYYGFERIMCNNNLN